MQDYPRILITGFSVFPGAPVNPTEKLIAALRDDPAALPGNIRLETLPVEYAAVPGLLDTFGREFAPDIAIHFGLSASATGFTLERLARNGIAASRADNSGAQPGSACIVDGAGDFPSTLPLDAIAADLNDAGLPVAWSDDAGGYLCNYLFYLSRSPDFAGFAPAMSGFVHVPPLKEDEPANPHAMSLAELLRGAMSIAPHLCGSVARTQHLAGRAFSVARRVLGLRNRLLVEHQSPPASAPPVKAAGENLYRHCFMFPPRLSGVDQQGRIAGDLHRTHVGEHHLRPAPSFGVLLPDGVQRERARDYAGFREKQQRAFVKMMAV
jgi:pyroglutamyl-peptidase